MGDFQRAGHMDVSNTVDLSDPVMVAAVVTRILATCYPGADLSPLAILFHDCNRLYSGSYPGYRACDVRYHNAQHVLDVTLAMARLLDGYERSRAPEDALGVDLAMTGIAAALFHDSGYIRRTRDTRHKNGAEYTRIHVSRASRSRMAELVFFSGTMDCGKSTLALQTDHNHAARGRAGIVFSRLDRAGEDTLSSRLGLKVPAVEVSADLRKAPSIWFSSTDSLVKRRRPSGTTAQSAPAM